MHQMHTERSTNKQSVGTEILNKQLVLKRSVVAVSMAIAAQTAMAQNAATQSAQPAMQTVVVTGSNLKRTDKEGPAPVSVITSQDILNSGVASVSDLMKLVPSMGSDTNQDMTSGSGFAKGVATASLRGLGSSATLILLNGRRMAPAPYADPNTGNSTLYDLNSIPLSAIERIEILQDGASAVYGSDAIGGVINFILKTSYQGAEVSARVGANDDGNFARRGVSGIFGHGDLDANGYTFMLTADVSERDRVARRDANDLQYEQGQILSGRFRSNYSSSISKYPTYYKETAANSRNFGVNRTTAPTNMQFNTGCPASEQITGSVNDGLLATSTLIGRTFCNYNADQFLETQSDGRDINLLAHGEIKVGRGVNVFSDVTYSRSQRDYTGAPITIGTTSVGTFTSGGVGTAYQTILPIGHPDNPFTDRRASVGYRFENLRGGSQAINETTRALVGIKGSNFGFDWESALLWNRAENEDTTYGRLYLPTLRKLMTENRSLASIAADPTISHDVVTQNQSQIKQWDGKATTEFGKLPGGAIGMAIGAEFRREEIKLNPDPLVASGQIYGLANTILDSSRDVKSAFVEFRTPVLKSLEFDFAGRWDKYPTLKTNFVPKIGGKWTINNMFAIRATYAEGFRAPSLGQVVPGGAQFFLNGVWDPKRCGNDHTTPLPGGTTQDCARNIAGTGGFNPELKPETSRSYNLGLIFSPTSNFDVTMDFYRIKRENEIVLGTSSDALKNEDRTPQNVLRDTNPANFIIGANGQPVPNSGPLLMVFTPWRNQGMTEISGMDIEARLRKKMGEWGSLSTTLRAGYVDEYRIQQHEGDPTNNVVGSYPNFYDWLLSTGNETPRWKSSISTTWRLADHSVNMSLNYVGPVSLLRVYDGDTKYEQPFCAYGTAKSTDAATDRDTSIPLYEEYYPKCGVKEWITVGLGYTYTGFKNWTMNVNVQNLFDKKAPYDPTFAATGYNPNLHNAYGRFFNLSARYTF
jgi:iron complex outermembrane receptor protein